MADQRHTHHTLQLNRPPVLTPWAAVVAERLGFAWEEAPTLVGPARSMPRCRNWHTIP